MNLKNPNPKIIIMANDITKLSVDAVVNAANSGGTMGGGVAGALRRAGGIEIEKEAIAHAPIKIGEAVLTTAGKLPCCHVIHAPTMIGPSERTSTDNIYKAVQAALNCADKHNLQKIAIPGMGTGVGRVPKDQAADAMFSAIKDTKLTNVQEIILIDRDPEMIAQFHHVSERYYGT